MFDQPSNNAAVCFCSVDFISLVLRGHERRSEDNAQIRSTHPIDAFSFGYPFGAPAGEDESAFTIRAVRQDEKNKIKKEGKKESWIPP